MFNIPGLSLGSMGGMGAAGTAGSTVSGQSAVDQVMAQIRDAIAKRQGGPFIPGGKPTAEEIEASVDRKQSKADQQALLRYLDKFLTGYNERLAQEPQRAQPRMIPGYGGGGAAAIQRPQLTPGLLGLQQLGQRLGGQQGVPGLIPGGF